MRLSMCVCVCERGASVTIGLTIVLIDADCGVDVVRMAVERGRWGGRWGEGGGEREVAREGWRGWRRRRRRRMFR